MAKTALITGITGQDGRHLAELLQSKGYEIFGLVTGSRNLPNDPFVEKFPEITLLRGNLADFSSLLNVINESQPDEIYNLGAVSSVGLSFSQPELTADITGLGVLRILEATRKLKLEDKTRVYQASSPEMFGEVRESPQLELTPFHPRSPYGVAKAFAHHTCVQYRESYDMFISAGILFNHESEYRGYEFVTRKISSNVARIKLGKQKKFSLGNISQSRDWGYAGDYVEAMWMMLQQDKPDDYVIATGESHTIREFVIEALLAADLDADLDKYIDYDPAMIRPSDVRILVGDASKAERVLGWKPKVTFKDLVKKMVDHDLRLEASR